MARRSPPLTDAQLFALLHDIPDDMSEAECDLDEEKREEETVDEDYCQPNDLSESSDSDDADDSNDVQPG